MRYFKRYWDEPRGDAHAAWGCSWWYFETDDAGAVARQIEGYDHGPTLRYHDRRLDDEFGKLSEKPLDISELAEFEISGEEFEQVWGSRG